MVKHLIFNFQDEICLGSKNGELLLNDDEYNYQPFVYSDSYFKVLLPLLNSEERKRITTDYCRRWFTKLSVDIGISIFSLNISLNPYQSVIIPSILNSTYSSDLLFNYNITTPSNLSMQFIKSGVLTIDSLKESGQYNLTVSDSHCIQTHKFSINQCQLDNGDDGSTNMGLAIGLPIGLVAAGATATGVFFYKKRVGSIKTKELLPEEHEMETVTTFQGGRLVELDKF